MSVIDILQQKITERRYWNDSTEAWLFFLSDYKTQILERSRPLVITGEILDKCQYDVAAAIREIGQGYDPRCAAIVRMINDIPTDADFTEMVTLMIPDESYISTLYDVFIATNIVR